MYGAVTVTVADSGGTENVCSWVIVEAGRGLSSSDCPRAIPTANTSSSTSPQAMRRPVELFFRRRW